MLETVIFAVVLGGTLVISNVIVTLATMKMLLNKKFLKAYIRKIIEVQEIVNDEAD